MRRIFGILIGVLGLFAGHAIAGGLVVVKVKAPAVNCVFSPSCTVTVTDTSGAIPLPGGGKGILQSRTYKGAAGSPAAGLYVYEYRVDLTAAAGNAGGCVNTLTIDFGPVVSKLDYNGDGITGDQVFVTTIGGLGTIDLASAIQTGRLIMFHFQAPVCPGAVPGGGKTSYFFGLVSTEPPQPVTAQVHLAAGTVNVAARAPESRWKLVGPQPVSTSSGQIYAGQVSAIAVNPQDPNTIYAGTAAGGVWKTTDGGQNWKPLTDNQPVSAIGSLALDPSNPAVIYAGTGSNFFAGGGILKSSDAGATWKLITGPFAGPPKQTFLNQYGAGGARVYSLAVSRTNGNVVLAAAGSVLGLTPAYGIYRSSDGGATWANVQSIQVAFTVLFHPTNSNVAFAAAKDGIHKSTDAGLTWNPLNGTGNGAIPIPNPSVGFVLALVTASPNTMYAGYVGGPGIYKTTDGGQSWKTINEPPAGCSAGILSVDPMNAKILFHGDISLCHSTDGGTTWAIAMDGGNGVVLHSDMRWGAFAADGGKFLIGNDGGIWSTASPGAGQLNWTDLNKTLATVMFYPNGLATHPSNPNISFGGTQDNGLLKYSGNAGWALNWCGDGGSSVFDFAAPATVYTTCGNTGRVYKSTSSGAQGSWVEKTSGIDPSDLSPKQEALSIDPADSNRLYFGASRVYRSDSGAGNWHAISGQLGGAIRIVTVAPGDSNTVWAGGTTGVQVTHNALGQNPSWSNKTAGLPKRAVTQIAVDPNDAMVAYVTISQYASPGDPPGHVFKTPDGGSTWIDLSANLPNVSANDIVIDPDVANTLYLGLDTGVFVSTNGGSSWLPLGTGLPRVPVYSLKLLRPARILRAATWGRSAWDLGL